MKYITKKYNSCLKKFGASQSKDKSLISKENQAYQKFVRKLHVLENVVFSRYFDSCEVPSY